MNERGGGSDQDRVCEILVDVVSSVLDGYDAAASEMGDDRDRLVAEATQREEERIKLFIIGFNTADDIFFSFDGVA